MTRIIHIGPDSQFVQFAARTFEEASPGANSYIIVTGTSTRPDSLHHPIQAGPVWSVSTNLLAAAPRLIRAARAADVIVAHAMTRHSVVAFGASRRRAVRVWSGWGYDYYGSDSDPAADLLEPMTADLVQGLSPRSRWLPPVRAVARSAFSRLLHHAARRADVFSAPVPGDLAVFAARFPEFCGTYSQLNYASVEGSFAGPPAAPSPANILVGNSASPTSNHLDVFSMLSDMDLADRRVVVPLNYGDEHYRDAVISRGRALLGDRFRPLIDRIPLAEYNALVATCDIVIMNHIRQQAVGNIGSALYAGAHVVLNDQSPVLADLRSKGAALMSVSELREFGLPRASLGSERVAVNRQVLLESWGESQVLKNGSALVQLTERLSAQRR